MTVRYANGKRAFGFCDRCGQRADLAKLFYQPYDQKVTRLRVCAKCLDKDHPQLQLGKVRKDDPEALNDPRPEGGDQGRTLTGDVLVMFQSLP